MSVKLTVLTTTTIITLLGSISHAHANCGDTGVPAKISVMQCKIGDEALRPRCNPLDENECAEMNGIALESGAIDAAGHSWLRSKKECAVSMFGKVLMVCPEGCFEASTRILVDSSSPTVSERQVRELGFDDRPMSLHANSSLEEPMLTGKAVTKLVAGEEVEPLFVFKLSNGRELKVTQHHAMVLADATVVAASDVREGDMFVSADGELIDILSIDRELTYDDVYNFSTDGKEKIEHVVVAEGVLVGDLRLQSDLGYEEAVIALRE